MPMIRHLCRLLLVVATLAVLPACAGSDSLVEKGQRIKTGKDRFDGYFGEVIVLAKRVKELDSDLFPLRQPLVEAFDVPVDAPLPKLMEITRERVSKFKAYGVTTSLRITPNPIVVLHQGEFGHDDVDELTLRAVQESAVRALATYRDYAEMLTLTNQLDERRSKLMDQLEQLGPGLADRVRIETEILGAGRILEKVRTKLLGDMRTCSWLLVALSEAVDTGGATNRDASCDEAMAHWKPARRSYRRGPAKNAGSPAPRPPSGGGAPAPAKKGGGDFDM